MSLWAICQRPSSEITFLGASGFSQADKQEAIVRCHRSFLVNLFQVKTIKGASHDMSLVLEPEDHSIPVSGTYRKQIIQLLYSIKDFN